MVDELRPLLWQHPQHPEHSASIDAQQMAVHNQFSGPNAVLLPAEDVYARLSTVKLSNYEPQPSP